MRLLARILVVAVALFAVLVALPLPADAQAGPPPRAAAIVAFGSVQQEPGIQPPRQWAQWDANSDGRISTDEFAGLPQGDQRALRDWVQDLVDLYEDGEVRDWAREHFDAWTYIAMDIPASGIGEQIGEAPGAIVDAGRDALRNAGESAAESALGAVAEAVGEAAADLSGYLGEELARTGRPQLSADWYQEHYGRMLGWAGLLMVPLALAAIGGAVVRGDTSQVGQTLLQVPIAYLLGVMAVSLVAAAAGLSTAMARSLVPSVQDSSRTIGTRVGNVLTHHPQLGQGLVLLLGLAIALAALATLLWLLLTEAAVYAVVLFFPLAFAGRVWPATAAWGRRLLTLALALIGARVVIFALWGLAMEGLADAAEGDTPLRTALALAALLAMTATAPTAALRLVPLVEGAETAGSPGASAQRGLGVAYQASSLGRSMGGGRGGGGRLPVTGQIAGAAARSPGGGAAAAMAGGLVRSSGKGQAGGAGRGQGQEHGRSSGSGGDGPSGGSSGGSRAQDGGRPDRQRGSSPSGRSPSGGSSSPRGGAGGSERQPGGDGGRARPEQRRGRSE